MIAQGLAVRRLDLVRAMVLSNTGAKIGTPDVWATRIAEVTFYVDDKVIFVDREAPYQTLHDFGSQPRRAVVKAVATHTAGFSVENARTGRGRLRHRV